MEKLCRCVDCASTFKVVTDPAFPVYDHHEVETNAQCPFCAKTNAIVWPEWDSFLVVPIEENADSK